MTANEAEIPNLPIMAKIVVRILYTGLVPEKSRRVKRNQCLQVMPNFLNIHNLLTRVGTSVKSKLLLGGHPVSSTQYVTRDTGSKTVSNHSKRNFS